MKIVFAVFLFIACSGPAQAAFRDLLLPGDLLVGSDEVEPPQSCWENYKGMHARIPGCKMLLRRDQRTLVFSFNKMRLLDKDYPPIPAKGGDRRVLFLGASGTSNALLPENESATAQLRNLIKKNGLSTTIINGAVEGYSPLNYAVFLGELLEEYRPAAVILTLTLGTDALDSALQEGALLYENGKPARLLLEPNRTISRFPRIFQDFFWSRPWMERMFRTFYLSGKRLKFARTCGRFIPQSEARTKCMLEPLLKNLQLLQEESKKRGARFFVALIETELPSTFILGPGVSHPLAKLIGKIIPRLELSESEGKSFLEKRGISLISLGSLQDIYSPPYLKYHLHLNEEGNRLFAQRVFEKIKPILVSTPKRP
jgi:hypothetical protein